MVSPWRTWNLPVAVATAASRADMLDGVTRTHGPAIRRMLFRMLGSTEDARDTYQDCVCQLVRRSSEIPLHSAAGYAYRTAANLALETIRGRQRRAAHRNRVIAALQGRRDPNADDPAGHRGSDSDHHLHELRQAVHALPPHLREVVVLRDLSEMPYSMVASLLGIRATTARVYRRQAIIRLQQALSARN